MTDASEKLCRMLDERGVEFKVHNFVMCKAVTWQGSVCEWVALPDEMGLAVAVYKDYLTPEQPIAATLGSGTLTAEQVIEAFKCHCTFYYDSKARDTESVIAEFQAVADELNALLGSGTCENERKAEQAIAATLGPRGGGRMSELEPKTNLLEPCPFCGCESFVRIDVSLAHTQSRYRVGCDKYSQCHGWYGHSRYYATEAEAIAAWNTRSATTIGKLTANDVLNAVYKHGSRWQAIADELNALLGSGTCENVAREWEKFAHAGTSFCCSECGAHYFDAESYYAGLAGKDEEDIRTNFCPNCGRKVVGDVREG